MTATSLLVHSRCMQGRQAAASCSRTRLTDVTAEKVSRKTRSRTRTIDLVTSSRLAIGRDVDDPGDNLGKERSRGAVSSQV